MVPGRQADRRQAAGRQGPEAVTKSLHPCPRLCFPMFLLFLSPFSFLLFSPLSQSLSSLPFSLSPPLSLRFPTLLSFLLLSPQYLLSHPFRSPQLPLFFPFPCPVLSSPLPPPFPPSLPLLLLSLLSFSSLCWLSSPPSVS